MKLVIEKDRVWVLLLLALGLVARVALAQLQGDAFQFPDEAIYADTARRLAAGDGFGEAYRRVPAYPVFLAAIAAPEPSVLYLRIAQAIATSFGTLLMFVFTASVFGRGPALAAALFYALDPMLVAAGGLLYPEAISAILMIGIVFAAVRALREDHLPAMALAGALLGIFVQLRPVALTLMPALVLWVHWQATGRQSRRLVHTMALVTSCLLTLVPWTYRNYRIHGDLVPVATAGTTAAASQTELQDRGLTATIVTNAWETPVRFADRLTREFIHFWELYPTRMATDDPGSRASMRAKEPRLSASPAFDQGLRDAVSAVSFIGELLLAGLGIGVAWRLRRREVILATMLIVAYALGYALFVAKLRYRIPVLPLIFAFSGIGLAAICEFVWSRARMHSPRLHSVCGE